MNSKGFFSLGMPLIAIVIVLGLMEIVFLGKIEPYNYVFALIIFIIAAAMAAKMFASRESQAMTIQKEKEPETIEFRPQELSAEEFIESSKASGGEEEGKLSLDEFILSSPKKFKEKRAEESTEKKLEEVEEAVKTKEEEVEEELKGEPEMPEFKEEKIEFDEELKKEMPPEKPKPKEVPEYEIIKPKEKKAEAKKQKEEYEEMKKKAFKELKQLVEGKEEE